MTRPLRPSVLMAWDGSGYTRPFIEGFPSPHRTKTIETEISSKGVALTDDKAPFGRVACLENDVVETALLRVL